MVLRSNSFKGVSPHDKKEEVFIETTLSKSQNVSNSLQVNILDHHIVRIVNIMHFVPMCMMKHD